MKVLNNEEMFIVQGGAAKVGILVSIIGGAVVFIMGIFDGWLHPKKCN